MAALIVLFVLVFTSGTAMAEAIYKCTSGARISYGQTPCPDGPSIVINSEPAPTFSAADKARLANASKAAARIDTEHRKAAEKAAHDDQLSERRGRAAAASAKKCATLKLRSKWAGEDARAATDKQALQAMRKASRAAEQLALECPA